jgi:parallel beta-helix repeat protein
MSKRQSLTTGAGVTVGATLLMGGAAQAATLTVGSTADTTGTTNCAVATNTDCTLRDAIEDANAAPGSTITFRSGVTGTIELTSNMATISQPTTISGPGAGQLTISGKDAYRVFYVDTAAGADVSISGLTIARGFTAGKGGGVYSKYADLTLDHTVVRDSHGGGGGGGVSARGGSLTVRSSTISGNDGGFKGAGVYAVSGSESSSGLLHTPTTIRNSTISGNTGSDYGGGVYFDYSAPGTLENSTVYDNSASKAGGGVFHFGRPDLGAGLTITGSTITRNDASHRGGGVASRGMPGDTQPRIRDTIVSGNTSGDDGADISAYSGSMGVGFSLIGSPDPATSIDTLGPNLIGADPQLTSLADFGGPTKTQKPAATSPVIDTGSAFSLASDQRGLVRPFDAPTIPGAAGGDGSDIGAVELQSGDVSPAPPTPAAPGSATSTKTKCKKKKKPKRSAESAKKKGCKKKKKKR